ncbi:uncharacterized protein [Asterias amurensis]|uniref:uncharacterized protein n=1 Tax=Asterias amurensis TaxID=7602 RepID=UPI003AB22919
MSSQAYKPLHNVCDDGVESAEMLFQSFPGQTSLSIPSFPPADTTIITSSTQPKDYQIFAIFVTLFCCLPLGILGIFKSSEVRRRAAMGDTFGAHQASYRTKSFLYAGLGVGLLVWVCSATAFVVFVVKVFGDYTFSEEAVRYEFVTVVVPIGK